MRRESLTKAAIVAIVATPVLFVVLSTWRFRLESTWRMDPLPFAFFVALSIGIGWIFGRLARPGG